MNLFMHQSTANTVRWQQQIEAIARLPKAQQRLVTHMLDTVLAQQIRQSV